MIGNFKFDENLNVGRYSGTLIGKGEKRYLNIHIEFVINRDGLMENPIAKIEDISGNF